MSEILNTCRELHQEHGLSACHYCPIMNSTFKYGKLETIRPDNCGLKLFANFKE